MISLFHKKIETKTSLEDLDFETAESKKCRKFDRIDFPNKLDP